MESKNSMSVETEVVEFSALAKLFGEFLRRKALSHHEIMEKIGTQLIDARDKGDSFIIVNEEQLEALNANPQLLTGEEALCVLEGSRLYLFREHCSEVKLAHAIAQRILAAPPAVLFTDEEVSCCFSEVTKAQSGKAFTPHPNQVAAVQNALARNFSIISGGPGTGKTTIIASLVALERRRDPDIVIEIAAPTGKAAELLTQELAGAFPGAEHPLMAHTLHTLFAGRPGTGRFERNSESPLECDLLIVDECSMISLDVAAKMFSGLKPGTRVVLSGDHRQLEAIGSGAVLSSLLTFVSDVPAARKLRASGIELIHNYRSILAPEIQGLAKAIREEKDGELLCGKIMQTASGNYSFLETGKQEKSDPHSEILEYAAEKWQELTSICQELTEESVKKAFDLLNTFRVITAARVGSDGCVKFNEEIREKLGLDSLHAPGSALLITRNCRRTKLANGDVGIVFADKENDSVKVCFKNLPNPLPFHELPPFESAFAMTVHKAQGSGFAEVYFPLPAKDTPLLTKELFYTALTRAARKITISGSKEIVKAALSKESCRAAALAERIIEELREHDEK